MENNDLNGIDIPASFEIDIQLDAIYFFHSEQLVAAKKTRMYREQETRLK